MAILKGELQADNGDALYPHTSANIVFMEDGKTVEEIVKNGLNKYIVSSGDLNTLTKEGFYEINNTGEVIQNLPEQGQSYSMIVMQRGSNTRVTQIASNNQNNLNKMFRRTLSSSGWSAWQSFDDADTLDGKHASDFLLKSGGVMKFPEGTIQFKIPEGNSENGIEGGDGDGAGFEKCALDIYSWNGIGFYPKAGGAWGNGKSGRSVVIDPRAGYVRVKGGLDVNGVNVMKEINNLKSSATRGAVKNVQRGYYKLYGDVDEATITISAVNLSKSLVFMTCMLRSNTTDNTLLPAVQLANSTTISVKRSGGSSIDNTEIEWQVIEFY